MSREAAIAVRFESIVIVNAIALLRIDMRLAAIAMAMVIAAALAIGMKPTKKIADVADRVSLERMIPQSFGEWRIDTSIVPIQVSPDVQAALDKIYSQTLSRTYVNLRSSQRIMLSIAYGENQADKGLRVHRPEICYTAQGFQIWREQLSSLATEYGSLPIKRLFATSGNRKEPITYWVTVGERAAHVGIKQRIAALSYSITGRIPDGMLVRVSSISASEIDGYALQDKFIADLLGALGDRDRVKLVGRFGA